MSFKPARPTRAPVNAEPAMKLGMARAGSAAPNGMAPSVMKESHITLFVKPESRYSCVILSLNNAVAAITIEPPEATDSASVPVAKT